MSRRLTRITKLSPTTQTTRENVSKDDDAKRLEKRPEKTLKRNDEKISKITATTSSSVTSSDDTTTPEFKLLYKLFVPNKYLIKNNKASMQNLLNHLPPIVPTSHSRLNLEVHIFLATIVVQFVSSWYLTKLNTDNFDFVRQIYQVLCDLVYDMSTRISALGTQAAVIDLVDEVAFIIDDHLKELVPEYNQKEEIVQGIESDSSNTSPVSFKFLIDSMKWNNERNTLNLQSDHRILCKDWLSKRHVIFESDEPASDLKYYRILVKKILATTFQYDPSPLNSQIVEALVVHLAGDLVVAKLTEKLSSPEFILGLVTKVAQNLETVISQLNEKKEKENDELSVPSPPILNESSGTLATIFHYFPRLPPKLHNVLRTTYQTFALFTTSISSAPTSSPPNFILNSIFSLLNTLTNLASRKPILTNVLIFAKDQISRFDRLHSKINDICLAYMTRKIVASGTFSEQSLCKILADLRVSLFENKNGSTVSETANVTDLVEVIFNIITSIPQFLPFAAGDPFRYYGESDKDLKDAIRRIIDIFNSPDGKQLEIIGNSLDFNKLLIMRLIDCAVARIYPELVEDTSK